MRITTPLDLYSYLKSSWKSRPVLAAIISPVSGGRGGLGYLGSCLTCPSLPHVHSFVQETLVSSLRVESQALQAALERVRVELQIERELMKRDRQEPEAEATFAHLGVSASPSPPPPPNLAERIG